MSREGNRDDFERFPAVITLRAQGNVDNYNTVKGARWPRLLTRRNRVNAPGPARTVTDRCCARRLYGLRAGEIRGLTWEAYTRRYLGDDGSLGVIRVLRSVPRRRIGNRSLGAHREFGERVALSIAVGFVKTGYYETLFGGTGRVDSQ
jgi:hypothetical protein